MDAAVIVVGDEILSGHVRDANGHFIAGRLAAHGHRLRSIDVVPDEPASIAAGVRSAVETVELVFVCGGVGPTHDDCTMEGVAAALGVPLVSCPPIAERMEAVAASLAGRGVDATVAGIDGLRKMALVPEGAEALPTERGWIPAVALRAAGATVVVLPGPPKELEAIFRDAVEPRLLAGAGEEVHREEITHPFPESAVARMLDEVRRATPGVAVGSYPMEGHSLVRVSGPKEAARRAAAAIREQIAAIEASPAGQRLLEVFRAHRH